MTKVENLYTGEARFYTLPPMEAVRAAWLQARGNFNTWSYGNARVPIEVGKHTIAAGDWCAMK